MMKRPINDIETTAAEWAAHEDGGAFSAERQLALDVWLKEDPRHLGAYLKMRATLLRVERMGSVALRSKQRQSRPLVFVNALLQARWRYAFAGALAASLAIIASGVLAWNANTYDMSLKTAVGQTNRAIMPDGSVITLNTDSEVQIHYNPFGRNVTVKCGEVLFDVAKHKQRPFVVTVAETKVRAIGTSFMVTKLMDHPFRAMVREGVVEISNAFTPHAVAVRAGWRAEGQANGRISVASLSSVQVAHDLDWLGGRIFFRHETLASAAKEFERYSTMRIVIDDPAVASKTVTGMFVATDPAAFAKAVSAVLDLRVETSGKTLQLSRKQR